MGEPSTEQAAKAEAEHEGADDDGDGFDVDAKNREEGSLPDDLVEQRREAGEEEEGRQPASRGDQVLTV